MFSLHLKLLLLGSTMAAIIMAGFALLPQPTATPSESPVQEGDFGFPPPYTRPYFLQADKTEFSRVDQAGARLDLNRGDTRSVSIQIIPEDNLFSPTVLQFSRKLNDAGRPTLDMVGVDVSFSPSELLLKPGETSIVTLTFHVNADAADQAYLFGFQILSEEFPGKLLGTFQVLIGDADPLPRHNPLVEEIEEIFPGQLQDYKGEGWEVVKELEDGKFLVKRLVPANP